MIASPVFAETDIARRPENRADIQCFAVFAVVSGLNPDDISIQAGAVGGMMYYYGQLKGRAPEVDWFSALTDYIDHDLDESFKLEADRCGQELIVLGGQMTEWGEEMQAIAAKQSPK